MECLQLYNFPFTFFWYIRPDEGCFVQLTHVAAIGRAITKVVCDSLRTFYRLILFHLSSKSEENQEYVLYNCVQIIITGMMSAACSRRDVQACWPVAVTYGRFYFYRISFTLFPLLPPPPTFTIQYSDSFVFNALPHYQTNIHKLYFQLILKWHLIWGNIYLFSEIFSQ
jgi:hypothetical protein